MPVLIVSFFRLWEHCAKKFRNLPLRDLKWLPGGDGSSVQHYLLGIYIWKIEIYEEVLGSIVVYEVTDGFRLSFYN